MVDYPEARALSPSPKPNGAELRNMNGLTASVNGNGSAMAPKVSKTAGSLAAIHENLKQLGELNDEFLDGHERLAETLNKAPSGLVEGGMDG